MFLTKYSESMMFLRKDCLWCVVWLLCITVACIGVGCGKGGDVVTPTETEEVTEVVEVTETIEPDSPSPEEQLAGKYDLIEFDYLGDWIDIIDDQDRPFVPPEATGTLSLFEGDTFLLKWWLPRATNSYRSNKWTANKTKIFIDNENGLNPEDISYAWQGTDRRTLVLKMLGGWGDPPTMITVWKRVE